jgi:hypothetical protein
VEALVVAIKTTVMVHNSPDQEPRGKAFPVVLLTYLVGKARLPLLAVVVAQADMADCQIKR